MESKGYVPCFGKAGRNKNGVKYGVGCREAFARAEFGAGAWPGYPPAVAARVKTISSASAIYWWARQDSNLQPDGYEPSALTIELQAPPC